MAEREIHKEDEEPLDILTVSNESKTQAELLREQLNPVPTVIVDRSPAVPGVRVGSEETSKTQERKWIAYSKKPPSDTEVIPAQITNAEQALAALKATVEARMVAMELADLREASAAMRFGSDDTTTSSDRGSHGIIAVGATETKTVDPPIPLDQTVKSTEAEVPAVPEKKEERVNIDTLLALHENVQSTRDRFDLIYGEILKLTDSFQVADIREHLTQDNGTVEAARMHLSASTSPTNLKSPSQMSAAQSLGRALSSSARVPSGSARLNASAESPSFIEFTERLQNGEGFEQFEDKKFQLQLSDLSKLVYHELRRTTNVRFNTGDLFAKWEGRYNDMVMVTKKQVKLSDADTREALSTDEYRRNKETRDIQKLRKTYQVLDAEFQSKVEALNHFINTSDDFEAVIGKLNNTSEDEGFEELRGYVIGALNQTKVSRKDKDSTVEIKNAKDGQRGVYDDYLVKIEPKPVHQPLTTVQQAETAREVRETDYVTYSKSGQVTDLDGDVEVIPVIFDNQCLRDYSITEPLKYPPQNNSLVFDELTRKIEDYQMYFDEDLSSYFRRKINYDDLTLENTKGPEVLEGLQNNQTQIWPSHRIEKILREDDDWWHYNKGTELGEGDIPLDSDLNPWVPAREAEPKEFLEDVKKQIASAPFLSENDKKDFLDAVMGVSSGPLVTWEAIQNAVKPEQIAASTKTLDAVATAKAVLKSIAQKKVDANKEMYEKEMATLSLDTFKEDEKKSLVGDLIDHSSVKTTLYKIASEINTLKKEEIDLIARLNSPELKNADFDGDILKGQTDIEKLAVELEAIRAGRGKKLSQVQSNLIGTQFFDLINTDVDQIKPLMPILLHTSDGMKTLDGVQLTADAHGNGAVVKAFSLIEDSRKGPCQTAGVKLGDVLVQYDLVEVKGMRHAEVLEVIKRVPSPAAIKFFDPEIYYKSLNDCGLGLSLACPLHARELHVGIVKDINEFPSNYFVQLTVKMPHQKVAQPPQILQANSKSWKDIPLAVFPTVRNLEEFNPLTFHLGTLVVAILDPKKKEVSRREFDVHRAMSCLEFIFLPTTKKAEREFFLEPSHSISCTELLLQRVMKEHQTVMSKVPRKGALDLNPAVSSPISSRKRVVSNDPSQFPLQYELQDMIEDCQQQIETRKQEIIEKDKQIQEQNANILSVAHDNEEMTKTIEVLKAMKSYKSDKSVRSPKGSVSVTVTSPKASPTKKTAMPEWPTLLQKDLPALRQEEFEAVPSNNLFETLEQTLHEQEVQYEAAKAEADRSESEAQQVTEKLKKMQSVFDQQKKLYIFQVKRKLRLLYNNKLKLDAVSATYEHGLMAAEEAYTRAITKEKNKFRQMKAAYANEFSSKKPTNVIEVQQRMELEQKEKEKLEQLMSKVQTNVSYFYNFSVEENKQKRDRSLISIDLAVQTNQSSADDSAGVTRASLQAVKKETEAIQQQLKSKKAVLKNALQRLADIETEVKRTRDQMGKSNDQKDATNSRSQNSVVTEAKPPPATEASTPQGFRIFGL